jgi:hypothetical protein
MRSRRRLAVVLGLVTCAAHPRPAGAACDATREVLADGIATPTAELLRMAQLAGAAPLEPDLLRRGGTGAARLCADGDGFAWAGRLAPALSGGRHVAVIPVRLESVWNGSYPSAGSDRLLWAGRGFSTLASAGVYARFGALSAAAAPEAAWQQNAWFETVPTGRTGDLAFENPWYRAAFDVPQRFGAGPFARASPGQSFVRVDAFGAAAGVSTENLWLGPGLRNAILMTNAGPGFPHAFLGTSAPVDVGIGKLEALALWGRLDRSRYGRDRGRPWITALVLDWEPRWVPGLYLGAARAFVESYESLRSDAFLSVLESPWKSHLPGGDNPEDNQVAVLWFRWVLAPSGMELYGEWGKDDFPASFGALIRETERTQAWLLGFQRVSRVGSRWLRVQVELAKLAGGGYAFYGHDHGVGYTNGGQPLGASAGPGGISSMLAVDVLGGGGRFGGFVERLERNVVVFDTAIAPSPGRGTDRDTEIMAGVRHVLVVGSFELSWEASGGYRWNRDFIRNEPNARVALSIAAPPAQRAPDRP